MREADRMELDHELSELEKEMRGPLSSLLVRKPNYDNTQRLILSLQDEFNGLTSENDPFSTAIPAYDRPSLWKQLLHQLRSYHKSYAVASLFLFVMLTLVGDAMLPMSGTQSIYALVVPLLIIVGTIYSFSTWNAELRMVESITPFPPALLLLSKLIVVLLQCIAYGLVGTVYLELTAYEFQGLHFLMNWLGIAMFVSGVMAYVMFSKGYRAGIAAGIAAWLLQNQFMDWSIQYDWLRRTDLFAVEAGLLIAGLILMGIAYKRSFTAKLIRQ